MNREFSLKTYELLKKPNDINCLYGCEFKLFVNFIFDKRLSTYDSL